MFSRTETVNGGICRWPGCCCRRVSCLCLSPCPYSRVCACACVCACASSSSSCAHGGGGDDGGCARRCAWTTKTWSLSGKVAPAWQAWRAWTVPPMVALYLRRGRGWVCLIKPLFEMYCVCVCLPGVEGLSNRLRWWWIKAWLSWTVSISISSSSIVLNYNRSELHINTIWNTHLYICTWEQMYQNIALSLRVSLSGEQRLDNRT